MRWITYSSFPITPGPIALSKSNGTGVCQRKYKQAGFPAISRYH